MKEKTIIKSTVVVVITLIFVKLIGVFKQAVIAAFFGTTSSIDQFLLVAEFMENFGAAIFSALSITFLTIFVNTIEKEGRFRASTVLSNTFVNLLPIVIGLGIICFVFARQITCVIAPGFDDDAINVVTKYVRIFSFTLINMFIFYIGNAALEAEKIFFPGKIVGVIRSICVIGAIVIFSRQFDIYSMLIGVVLYYICESLMIIICVSKHNTLRIYKPLKDNTFLTLLRLSVPLFISYGTVQIQSIVDKAIASGLPEGSVATLSYGGYLYNTTHSILVGGLCTVLFSFFSSFVVTEKKEELLQNLYKYLKICIIILSFVTLLYFVCASDIVTILYQRGAFTEESTKRVTYTFIAYSCGLVFIGIRDILIRTHYAFQNNKQAMINGIIGVVINIIGSIVLSHYWGAVGIAFATSIASVCVAFLSCITIRKNIPEFNIINISKCVIKTIVAMIVTFIVVYVVSRVLVISNCILRLAVYCLICSFAFVAVLWIEKTEELSDIANYIKSRLKK